MTALRLFTDEDIFGAVAPALRRAGYDAVSTPEMHRSKESDESQLAWATAESRAIISFNVAHFSALHSRWMNSGRHHAGIIVSSQRPIGELLRRLLSLASTLDGEVMRDRLEFLTDWQP
jgi:hypothetical protein